MENKQAVECQNAQMGYFCFFRYFFRRGNLFFDKIIKNILTKQKSYDILNYVATALCNINTIVFQRFALTGILVSANLLCAITCILNVKNAKQNAPTITGTFCFFIAFLPYVILIFFILHPPSIQQILSSLCTGKG